MNMYGHILHIIIHVMNIYAFMYLYIFICIHISYYMFIHISCIQNFLSGN